MFKQLSRQFVLVRNPTHIQRHLFSSSSRLLVDLWPLPHTPEHLASTTTPADSPQPPLPRLNETIETLRARLVYQSRKRGTLETDLLLSTFARDRLSAMTHVELKEYDKVCFLFRIVVSAQETNYIFFFVEETAP
jgi:succinate dehydrogenase assembly factor 2